MTKRALQITLIINGLILAALAARRGELLVLAVPFLVYLIAGLMQAPGAVDLRANRIVEQSSVTAQDRVAARVVIENRGRGLVNLTLADTMLAGTRLLDGQAQQCAALLSGEVTDLTYQFAPARGVYSWSTIAARASDPFDLFETEAEIPAAGNLFVRPAPLQLRSTALRPRATLPTAGPIAARKAGSGTDFWGIRQYRAGDTLRWVNWRLAARYPGQLYTNEFEREEIADFGMILDARRLTHAGAMEQELFEYSVSAAASMAENFLRNGNRVSLTVFGQNILTTFPGYGKRHFNSLLRNLTLAQLGGNLSFSHLNHVPSQLFPARSLMVVFSTVERRDFETYAHLRSYGYEVLLISPDPVDFAARRLPVTETNTLAVRAARVERVIQLKRLLQLGVSVVDWQVNQPLEPLVRAAAVQMNSLRKF